MTLHSELNSRATSCGSIHASLWPFDHETVYDAPETSGVYALWRYGQVILYGRADGTASTIRACLVEHLAGLRDRATRKASHFSWEISTNPAARERQLLSDFWATFDRLPSCNVDNGDLVVVRRKVAKLLPPG